MQHFGRAWGSEFAVVAADGAAMSKAGTLRYPLPDAAPDAAPIAPLREAEWVVLPSGTHRLAHSHAEAPRSRENWIWASWMASSYPLYLGCIKEKKKRPWSGSSLLAAGLQLRSPSARFAGRV